MGTHLSTILLGLVTKLNFLLANVSPLLDSMTANTSFFEVRLSLSVRTLSTKARNKAIGAANRNVAAHKSPF